MKTLLFGYSFAALIGCTSNGGSVNSSSAASAADTGISDGTIKIDTSGVRGMNADTSGMGTAK